jgi:predicted aspartyl protease
MIYGEFNRKGELVFDIGLIAADRTLRPVRAILDTGFNQWLLINNKDAENLEWLRQWDTQKAQTAGGTVMLNIYEGNILIDGKEWMVPVLGSSRVKDILLGVRWLRHKRLVADFAAGVLTLG